MVGLSIRFKSPLPAKILKENAVMKPSQKFAAEKSLAEKAHSAMKAFKDNLRPEERADLTLLKCHGGARPKVRRPSDILMLASYESNVMRS